MPRQLWQGRLAVSLISLILIAFCWSAYNEFWLFWERGWWGKYDADWDGVAGVAAPLITAILAIGGWIVLVRENRKARAATAADNKLASAEREKQFADERKARESEYDRQRKHTERMEVARTLLPHKYEAIEEATHWASTIYKAVNKITMDYTHAVAGNTTQEWAIQNKSQLKYCWTARATCQGDLRWAQTLGRR